MKYSEMTDDQRLAWGRDELAARKADLSVRTDEGLQTAKRNADARRRAIGASKSAAASMVTEATRELRWAAYSAADQANASHMLQSAQPDAGCIGTDAAEDCAYSEFPSQCDDDRCDEAGRCMKADQPRCFRCGHAQHSGGCVNTAPDQPEVATCDACDRVRHQWQRECADTDSLLQTLGLCPSEYRSDGGSLLLGRISHKLASIAAAKPEAK